jgi:hypothetical protein
MDTETLKTETRKYQKQKIGETENYNKQYYQLNKAKWKLYKKDNKNAFYNCDFCKCSVSYANHKLHLKSNKHKRNSQVNENQNTENVEKTI